MPHSLHLQRWLPEPLYPALIWFSVFPHFGHRFHASSVLFLISSIIPLNLYFGHSSPKPSYIGPEIREANRCTREGRTPHSVGPPLVLFNSGVVLGARGGWHARPFYPAITPSPRLFSRRKGGQPFHFSFEVYFQG